ncbi:DUF2243 domain-containing protein [Neorhizobium sp. T25_13]|uniref:DUF2243 domain-containing protein n=1 Tax=Neorhizobium sp. T25_13 TaxID=2093830 RepID=UPI00155F1CE6|nr:DUF2243 domain-containing protein [Neorhizobium sp. T25_13]
MLNHIFRSLRRSCGPAGFFIGLALAGFFDGILLHQILQWHSLFSSLDGQVYQDIRFRMLTDGAFHAAMYGIGLVGLWLLWRGRYEFASDGSGKRFASALLFGFGVWHLTDAVLNHWLLGLHHIKEDSRKWLLWDLAFFVLGLVCAGLGITFDRFGGRRRLSNTVASSVGIIAFAAGAVAASPWSNPRPVTVVFKQGISPAAVLAAVENANGQILWSNADGDVWAIALKSSFDGWSFYRYGALYVSGSVFGMGCFSATPAPST